MNNKADLRNKLTPLKNLLSLIDNNILILNDLKYKTILNQIIQASKDSITFLTK